MVSLDFRLIHGDRSDQVGIVVAVGFYDGCHKNDISLRNVGRRNPQQAPTLFELTVRVCNCRTGEGLCSFDLLEASYPFVGVGMNRSHHEAFERGAGDFHWKTKRILMKNESLRNASHWVREPPLTIEHVIDNWELRISTIKDELSPKYRCDYNN